MDALYPVIGDRRLICHSEVDALHEPCALILDTNVIKDIGSFYFGHRHMSPELRQILSYIRRQCRAKRMSLGASGICYRLGLTELSLKRNDGVNYSLFRNYGSAVCKFITCEEDEFVRICDTDPSYTCIHMTPTSMKQLIAVSPSSLVIFLFSMEASYICLQYNWGKSPIRRLSIDPSTNLHNSINGHMMSWDSLWKL